MASIVTLALDRLETCFKPVNLRSYKLDGEPYSVQLKRTFVVPAGTAPQFQPPESPVVETPSALGFPVAGSMPPADCASRKRNEEINPVSDEALICEVDDRTTFCEVNNAAVITPTINALRTSEMVTSTRVKPLSAPEDLFRVRDGD